MKKKLLISAVLALVLVCLFAIAVGATTYNYSDEEGNLLYSATAELKANRYEMITTESGSLAKTDASGNSLTWYVVADDNGTNVRNITVKSIKTADAGVITEGKFTFTGDVTANNVVSVNFFGMDVKTFDKQLFMTTAQKTPSGSNSEYCQVANGKYLLFLYLPKSLTAIPENFCYRTSLRVLEFEDNIVHYNTVPQNAFQYMANLKSLTIPEGIQTLQVYSFRECLSLAYLKFPSTMSRLEHNVFYRSIGFETVIFGENMTYIGYLNSDYTTVYNSWNIKNYNIKYMYVPNSVNTANSSFDTFRGKDNNYINIDRSLVFLFTGTLAEAKAVANCSADRHFKSAVNGVTSAKNSTIPGQAPITYSEYIANQSYYDNLKADRHVLVYNVPACVAYGHKYASNVTSPDCVNGGYTTYTCTVCGDSYTDNVTEALGHNMSGWKVSEGNVIVNECSRCDYAETRTAEASVNGVFYETFAEAYANFADGAEVVLYVDLSFNSILVIDKSVTLDGNGKTISSTAGRAINVSGADGVTIKNITISASGERAINIIQNATNVTIDNVTATAANYTVNVASSAKGAVVAIKNSTLNGLCTVNVAAIGAQVTVDNSTVNCNDNNTTAGESYAALALNKEAIGGSIVATNSTINVVDGSDSCKGRNGAENGTLTIDGSTEDVMVIVAVITYEGSDYYHSFQTIAAAIKFAKDGDVVTLIRDVELSEILLINKSVTLDGNGKTLTSTAARAINVETTGKVAISNLTIVAGERAINIINQAATVEIDNVTATASNNAVMVATSAGAAKVTIKNSDFTGLAVINVAGAGAEITIIDTDITNVDATDAENYGAITVYSTAENAKITVDALSTITVSDDSRKAYVFPASAKVEGVDDVGIIVATIGDAGFETFDEALEYAKAGDTVALVFPVTVTKSVEYTIPAGVTISSEGDAFIVTNGATLTLKGNGTVNAGITGVGSWVAVWANGGHAVIYGGTYTVGGDSSTTDVTHQNDLIYTKNGGTVTIYGGTFVAGDGIWALNQNDKTGGAIVVYGGTFEGFDPANNASEGPNTSFVANGYHSVAANGTYTVEACEYTLTTITYADYAKAGVKVYTCASCGATTEEAADALFITLGYSASEAELGGITVGYKMNNEAIAEYEAATGIELTYGVFAAAASTIGNNDIFDANGALVDGVISKEASSLALDALNLKIVGFNTAELMEAELVMGMYVNNGDSVSYVQAESPIDGKYHTVSYNKLTKEEE